MLNESEKERIRRAIHLACQCDSDGKVLCTI